MIDNARNRTSATNELDEDELFTVCLDDDGHPVQRAVRDMTAGEVIAAIDTTSLPGRHASRRAKSWRGCGGRRKHRAGRAGRTQPRLRRRWPGGRAGDAWSRSRMLSIA